MSAQQYEQTPLGVKVNVESLSIEIQFFNQKIVRVLKHPQNKAVSPQSLSVVMKPEKPDFKIKKNRNVLRLKTSDVAVILNLSTGQVSFSELNSRLLFSEKNQGAEFKPATYNNENTYIVKQSFLPDKQEVIYGLGQHQSGKMNQRNQKLYLRQSNMEICIPYIHSVKGYGMFWDNYSPTNFVDENGVMSFESEAGDCVDYYFMFGGTADGVIAEMRTLTGQAPMFPLWTFGFWQSRERYRSQAELIDVVKRYRALNVPLDGIIQDWQYWSTDNAYWNGMEFGNPEFPNPKQMIDDVHNMNVHIMASVWASFGPKTKPYAELEKNNMLFDLETYPQNAGVKVYDPYHPKAREIYWKYMNNGVFSLGLDAWWLDSTEPDHSNIKDKDFDNNITYLGSFRKVRNAFPLMSVGGVYENQRKTTSAKRVFILTRSAFAGQQRYAANSWSGDITASWDVLRKQIPAGLNLSLTGIPYWNSDIGAFWTNNHFPKGIKDLAYQELYVRWMQFATFTGMMRSHGTHTPREIFQFGEKGYWAYDVQEKFINLRYRLLPYIYSTSWNVTSNSGSIMRALFMDYPKDTTVHEIDNEYLFGNSILVAPVTEEMYVTRSGENITACFDKPKTHKVYLPKGNDWFDFWTGERLNGGREIDKEVPIDIIPLYVKAGSIIPVGERVQYAGEKKWDTIELRIYEGADGEFTLYEDETDNYNYEKGFYSTIKLNWKNKSRSLIIGNRQGSFQGMLAKRTFKILLVNSEKGAGIENVQVDKEVTYQGKEIRIKL